MTLVKQNKSSFKWRRFEPAGILLRVHRYRRCRLSYRDIEEMRDSALGDKVE
jgi:transposase-like protein